MTVRNIKTNGLRPVAIAVAPKVKQPQQLFEGAQFGCRHVNDLRVPLAETEIKGHHRDASVRDLVGSGVNYGPTLLGIYGTGVVMRPPSAGTDPQNTTPAPDRPIADLQFPSLRLFVFLNWRRRCFMAEGRTMRSRFGFLVVSEW